MATCDGRYEPNATAPPNWVLTPENLYNGRLLDQFASIYAAADLSKQTQPGEQNQEYTTRKNQWLDVLGRLKLPPTQNTHIVDLGLTPDLCHQGPPVVPDIPSLSPEALANGSVGNAVAELYKGELFKQWCECVPKDYEKLTCPCQVYAVTSEQRIVGPPSVLLSTTIHRDRGKISSITRRLSPNGLSTQIGYYYNIGCSAEPVTGPLFEVLIEEALNEPGRFQAIIKSIVIEPGTPVIPCDLPPPVPPPTPYIPGLPFGVLIGIPTPLPVDAPAPFPVPVPFLPVVVPYGTPTFPTDCPPVKPCDYMYWTLELKAASSLYSDTPPPSGVLVSGTVDTVDFDVSFDINLALADTTLRSWRKRTQPASIDTTFINVAICYLMIDGVALGDGVELNVPRLRVHVPIEYRDRAKSLKIMPKGINTPLQIFDAGSRWTFKKFPTPP